jgi:DNA-3-methyladenine glycosylase II
MLPRLTRATLLEGTQILKKKDRRLGRWIETVGPVSLRRQRHQFGALCCSIISQQIGSAAAKSIHGRFSELFTSKRGPNPAELLGFKRPRLLGCGLSRSKVDYLKGLAREFHDGSLARARLGSLEDSDVMQRLTQIRGIGPWTVEMFLIFSLGRLDVFSVRDLALRTGVERVVEEPLTAPEIEEVASRWSPYRSVACLYLWKIAHWK